MADYTISPLQELSSFIKGYPDQSLHKQFQLLSGDFPYHRSVRGDGNCFYRAFIFEYLCKNTINNQTFTFCENICQENQQLTFDEQSYAHKFFKYIDKISQIENDHHREDAIQELFNKSEQFDKIMISYFRSANYFHLRENRKKYFAFFDEEMSAANQLERIKTYSAQAEGVQLPSLAALFQVKLYIFFIDKSSFQPVVFNQDNGKTTIYLFYRPGHYDLVYQSKDPHSFSKRLFSFVPRALPTKALNKIFNSYQRNSNSNENIKPVTAKQAKTSQPSSSIYPQKKIIQSKVQSTRSYEIPTVKKSQPLISKTTPKSSSSIKKEKPLQKPKVYSSTSSLNQFHSLFLELVAIGLLISGCFFIYSMA